MDFQPPDYIDPVKVQEIAWRMSRGDAFPPVVVYFDGQTYWLADGFHRVAAAKSLRHRKINAEIVPGTYADMQAEWERTLRAIREDLRTCR